MAVRRLYTERPGVVADSTPPQGLSFLFYFLLDADHCDAVVGDLEERYKLIFGKFGKNKADLWYWKETIRTIGPIAWSWFKKLVMKPAMAVLGWMVAHGLVKDGTLVDWLVEVVKRIRG
jgi:hypothetical protein